MKGNLLEITFIKYVKQTQM